MERILVLRAEFVQICEFFLIHRAAKIFYADKNFLFSGKIPSANN
jgi:hypothetical protein